MQSRFSFKTFGTTRVGRIILLVIAIVVLSLSFIYLGAFIAIVAFLLFGLAIPIYAGWKIPRQLAVAGAVALLVSGPVIAGAETALIRMPSPLAASPDTLPYTGSVLANATVSPFLADQGTNFSWTVDLTPYFLPTNASGVVYVLLLVSNCPTGLGPNSPYCQPGYPFYELNQSFGATGTRLNQTVGFNLVLPSVNIWYWQMDAQYFANSTSKNLTSIFLDANGLATIEGPVTGSFLDTMAVVLLSVYQELLIYIASVFYIALLVYWIFKNRQRRRQAAAALPAVAPEGAAATGGATSALPSGSAPKAGGPSPDELNCPNCHAVVYPNEARCWKCGADLKGVAGPPSVPARPPTGGGAS